MNIYKVSVCTYWHVHFVYASSFNSCKKCNYWISHWNDCNIMSYKVITVILCTMMCLWKMWFFFKMIYFHEMHSVKIVCVTTFKFRWYDLDCLAPPSEIISDQFVIDLHQGRLSSVSILLSGLMKMHNLNWCLKKMFVHACHHTP